MNPVGDGVGTVELVEEVDVDETELEEVEDDDEELEEVEDNDEELEEVEDDDEELEGDMVPANVNLSICFSVKIVVGLTS